MALQSRSAMWMPPFHPGILGGLSLSDLALNATGKKVAYILQVPKTGTINQIGFRTRTVTTGDTLKIGLQTVSTANGDPSGTAYGGSTTVTQVIADADDNVWFKVTLGTGATAVRGDVIAVVIEFNSYVAGNMNLAGMSGNDAADCNFPYSDLYSGSAWSKQVALLPVCLIQYSDNTADYIPGAYPVTTTTTQTFDQNTTPDEYGLKFRIPFPCTLLGFAWIGFTALQDSDFKLYDSDGTTVLKTTAWEGNFTASGSVRHNVHIFASSQNLLKNTFYRLTIAPNGISATIALRIYSVAAALNWDQMEGGQDFHLSKRADSGSWTDVTTDRPGISLLISAADDGVQTGGLLVNRGMSGGVVN